MFKLTVLLLFLYHEGCFSRNLKSRILGGRLEYKGNFTFMVSIQETCSSRHICGGSVINPRWVLTAANCARIGIDPIKANDLRIYVGITARKRGEGTIYEIFQIILHPNFQLDGLKNDIALIQLITPMKFSETLTSIGLGWVPDKALDKFVVAGWGQTNEKGAQLLKHSMSIFMKIVDGKKCQGNSNARSNIVVGLTQICAFGGPGSTIYNTLCIGDTGCPLVHQATGQLVGIVSGFEGRCSANLPVLFTKVESYSSWISNVALLD